MRSRGGLEGEEKGRIRWREGMGEREDDKE